MRLRPRKKTNYNDNYPLPKFPREKYASNKLWPVRVLERLDDKVLVTYPGFHSRFNEWKSVHEITSSVATTSDGFLKRIRIGFKQVRMYIFTCVVRRRPGLRLACVVVVVVLLLVTGSLFYIS
jgi:hypothetical protein